MGIGSPQNDIRSLILITLFHFFVLHQGGLPPLLPPPPPSRSLFWSRSRDPVPISKRATKKTHPTNFFIGGHRGKAEERAENGNVGKRAKSPKIALSIWGGLESMQDAWFLGRNMPKNGQKWVNWVLAHRQIYYISKIPKPDFNSPEKSQIYINSHSKKHDSKKIMHPIHFHFLIFSRISKIFRSVQTHEFCSTGCFSSAFALSVDDHQPMIIPAEWKFRPP